MINAVRVNQLETLSLCLSVAAHRYMGIPLLQLYGRFAHDVQLCVHTNWSFLLPLN